MPLKKRKTEDELTDCVIKVVEDLEQKIFGSARMSKRQKIGYIDAALAQIGQRFPGRNDESILKSFAAACNELKRTLGQRCEESPARDVQLFLPF